MGIISGIFARWRVATRALPLLLFCAASCGDAALDGPAVGEDDRGGDEVTDEGAGAPERDGGPGDGLGTGDQDAGDAGTEAPPPQKEAFFNQPANGVQDPALEEKVKELVDKAVPGSQVYVGFYTWRRTPMTKPFIDAHARGVEVHMVLDGANIEDGKGNNAPLTELLAKLPAGRVTVCGKGAPSGACIGKRINHNKFILFSELSDGSKWVTLQSSANFTKTQLERWNNLVVIRDDEALYNGYRGYWDDLKKRVHDEDYYKRVDGTTGTRAYFFPRKNGDTVEAVLGNVTCDAGTKVRVAMGFFTKARINLAHALSALATQGCAVTVIVAHEPDTTDATVIAALSPAKVLPFKAKTGESVHSKYLLIEGTYGGTQRKLVWTGSHNYTLAALRSNDEALLRIDDASIYAAYVKDFTAMEAAAKK